MFRKNNIHIIKTWGIYSDQDDNNYIHVNAFRGKKKKEINKIVFLLKDYFYFTRKYLH